VHASYGDKRDGVKYSICEELGRVFDQFPRYYMKILFGEFSVKIGREYVFKPTNGNESLREITNDSGVKVVDFATSKDLAVKSPMFPHRNIHKYTWTSPEERHTTRLITF
jgi:hypothetical protein